MTRYLDISTDLAEKVRARRLRPGAELPAVRVYAAELGATASTISRAYRHLAQAGVVVIEARRRARIAPDGYLAALHLLHGERVFRLAGSDDPGLQLLLGSAGRSVVLAAARASFPALRLLAAGEADGAAIHLRHHTGEYNAPFAQSLLRDRDPHLLRLWRREQGLLLPRGNPQGIRGPADLAGRRMAKREHGAGSRVLLDQLMLDAGLTPESAAGVEFHSHLEVALAVASGVVDAGLAVRAAAVDLDLEFLPLAWEHYDLVMPGDVLGAAEPLIRAARMPQVQASIAALPGYDPADLGSLEALAPRRP
ncbi:substrate-binding domain-containing protein [Sporichthya sp.]|uniref:substrate-binding domain-containing protein n=1 Tax=Sporichthya sp. TaxID=65475 RepID=UPI00185A0735|nr:substrate-binding domain-containing protein [Sporichthya sp.]MBA3743740.1 GntR family transcriptional regulator [Sporichthya sp.]